MKRKTAQQIINRKFDAFLKSIDDDGLKVRIAENSIITGGCVASMLLNEPVNDFDVYFRDYETAKMVAKYYVKRFSYTGNGKAPTIEVDLSTEGRVCIKVKSAGIASEGGNEEYRYFEGDSIEDTGAIDYIDQKIKDAETEVDDRPPYRAVFLSANAITLANDVQLVLRFHGEPEDIHKNYDFIHCTNYWTSWDRKLVLHPDAVEAILTKELRYVGSLYPICSVVRLRKFIRRGWSITAGQILKMMFQISELDLSDLDVLEDQLTGVDMAYFQEVICLLKQRQDESGTKDVDLTYLATIIDRIF